MLRNSLSAIAISCISATGYAQDTSANTNSSSEFEEIIVTGIRSSLKKALEIKRNSTSVVDALSAEDIGVFPDENVAEALQRIPGIAISRQRGEGARVSIRGLGPDQNLTLLNGQFIASSNQFEDEQPSRSFNYALIASEVISSAEVYKTPEASIDEGGVGGTVILKTRKPLTLEKGYLLAGSIEGGYGDQTEELDPRFSLSTGWRNDDKTFGVILSAAYTERTTRGDGIGPLSYSQRPVDVNSDGVLDYGTVAPGTVDPTRGSGLSIEDSPKITGNEVLDADGNVIAIEGIESADGLFLPDLIANTFFPATRTRKGGSFAVEWQPSNELNFLMNGLVSNLGELGTNNNFLLLPLRAQNTVEPVNNAVVQDNTVVSGTIPQRLTDNPNWTGGRANLFTTALDVFDRDSSVTTYAFDLGTSWEPSDSRFKVFHNIGYTKGKVTASNRFFETVGFGSQTYDLTVGNGGAYSLSDDVTDPGTQAFSWVNFIGLNQVQDEFRTQIDITYDLENDFFQDVEFGVKYRRVSQDRIQTTTATSFNQVFANFGEQNGSSLWALSLADLNPVSVADNFLGVGFEEGIGNFQIPGPNGISDFFGEGNEAGSVFEGTNTVRQDDYFDIKEDVWAGYGQVNFNGEIGGIGVRGNVGTRITHLKRTSNANTIRDGVAEPFSQVDTQTDVLPSFNVAFDVSEELVLRFSAARALARPTFRQLSPTLSVIEETRTGTAGNPNLNNFVANAFDFSAEYYYGDGNAISVATFYKDILSFVVNSQEVEPILVSGDNPGDPMQVVDGRVTRPRNGGGGEIYGIEFALLHNFDNLTGPLKGLGVAFNYTLSDSRVDDPDFVGLPGQSKHTVNTSLIYETGGFSSRLAYNYRSERFRGVSNGQNRFLEGNWQVDFNASYRINDWMTVFVEGLNITNELASRNYFATPVRIGGRGGFGRRFFFGTRFNF